AAEVSSLLTLANVHDGTVEDSRERCTSSSQPSTSNVNQTNPEDSFLLKIEEKEASCPGNEDSSSESKELPLKLLYRDHVCSKACLAKRPLTSYKGENPLKLPILCCFQRRHSKALDALSKSLDVSYKAPCGRSLRHFQDVQQYLLETKCSFLFVDHFSFNTYLQLGRRCLNREAIVFDFDISNGA
uniref:MBD domain-containing protein n=1 Tax=Sphenodon punctatus TaxID=8508 RepID=A0A8D0GHS4_SPHPU